MSTQQQIDAWNAAVVQKQQEKTAQETILKVEQEQLVKAEQARINADLAVQRAQSSGASPEQVAALQRQVRLADSAESDARIAAGKTQRNIEALDGSIRFNTSNRDQFQAALPAQGTPASTVADRPANARTNAAEIAPAPVPAASSPAPVTGGDTGEVPGVTTQLAAPVPRSAIEEGGDAEAQAALAVRNAAAEPVPSDSVQAEQIRAEAAAPQREFVYDETTGEMVASDSAQADAIRDEARINRPIDDPTGVLAAEDAAIAAQEAAQSDADAFEGLSRGPSDPTGVLAAEDAAIAEQEEIDAFAGSSLNGPRPVPTNLEAIWDSDSQSWGVYNFSSGEFSQTGFGTQAEAQNAITGISADEAAESDAAAFDENRLSPEEEAARAEQAAKSAAKNQATLNSAYKNAGSSDWRVRLQLAPSSNNLYNANPPGILKPLAATNGVVFPYTPQINTSYKANYEQYDLVHSNYRGVYYKNSRVDDLQIRATFTAQDTREADYLLAVIHFFRSVTKMFYGKDAERGSPPPLVFLSGLGPNQFNGHPCVVTNFQYNLPDNVDYIRATSVNNYGTDLLSRRTASRASGTAGLGATGNRILNAGLERFFPANKPAPDNVVASVNNTQLANYVPTKMDIDITLIPVQTRSQVSKQFSLKGFANGDLIKGGFW